MPQNIQFWFNPTTGTVVWFLFSTVCLVVLAVSVRILFIRMQKQRRERDFQEALLKHNLLGKPEETVVRDVVERHKISPPASILSNLAAFDQIASEEIQRTEREAIPLSERVDRIEYLYSIRLCAFAQEVSVGGIRNLVPDFKSLTVPAQSDRKTKWRAAETESHAVSAETATAERETLGLGGEEEEAMAKLLGN